MDRRTFLKAASSFALLLPWAGQKAFAQNQQRYPGPFLLCINAEGGWDTTMFFDPKLPYDRPDYGMTRANRSYETLGSRPPFHYAPVEFHLYPSTVGSPWLHSPETFLAKHGHRMLLLNGVNAETNAHPVGKQIIWGGHPTRAYPSVAALLAISASRNFEVPCAYLASSGGYLETQGLVPLSRADASSMGAIAYETILPDTNTTLFSEQTSQRIQQAQAQRIQQLNQQLSMSKGKEALGSYDKAMLAKQGLGAWVENLPKGPDRVIDQRLASGMINSLLQQAEMALYGFQTGAVVSASLSLGGFDSHSGNDNTQLQRLGLLFVLIEYILETVDALGLSDKVHVVVGSDFGRPPFYNANNLGKDHWNATSLMVFGPGIQGGRVLGKTADNLYPQHVNPDEPSERLDEASGGVILKPGHVHHELRRVLGLQAFNEIYGLLDTPLRLF